MAEGRDRAQVQLVTDWLTELTQAKEREKEFRKQGQKILDLYAATITPTAPFNILFSNTETLAPALYSQVPRPVVERRYHDDDPLGKASSLAAERCLSWHCDTNLEGAETFDDVMKRATLDALLPGRGVTALHYEATFTDSNEQTELGQDEEAKTQTVSYLDSEGLILEPTVWNRVSFGYALRWSQVPWIAYETYVDRPEATRLFGAKIVNDMQFTTAADRDSTETGRVARDERTQGLKKTACIYQIWDREGGKKVRYISAHYPYGYLKVQDDPLHLSGFFNCPRPLQFIEKSNSLVPTAFYELYREQAEELNELTRRIKRIVKAIKARGIYDGELGGDLQRLFEADDNELIPAEKGASIAAEKGLQNAIWFMPLDMLIATLTQLYQAREACKQVIYEITGIADIMRGASKASETLGAQQIKQTWGALRIKNKQKEVQRYVRDLFRMMLELSAAFYSEEMWAKITGLPYLTTPQVQQLTMQLQMLQQQQAMAPPIPPQPGQPPMPPNPALLQIQQQLQAPKWSEILALLKDDVARAYRIDIESNSTVDADATEDKQQLTEMMTAMGQVMHGIAPLVEQRILPFDVAKTLLLTTARKFTAGRDIEAMIQAMQPPAPPQPEQDVAGRQQVAQAQLQLKAQQADLALQTKTSQAEKALLEKSIDLELQTIQFKAEREKFELAKMAAEESLALKSDVAQTKLQSAQKVASLESGKFKTENVVNQKADSALNKGVGELKAMMTALMQTLSQQAQQHAGMMATMTAAMTAPKTRKAVRGKDGRIESVTEELAR